VMFNIPSSVFKKGYPRVAQATPFTCHFPSRYFTTSSDVSVRANVNDTLPLLEREHFLRVRKILEIDERNKISLEEYYKICDQQGVGRQQAFQLIKSLSDTGTVLYYPQAASPYLQDLVFLKPHEFNVFISKAMDHLVPESAKRQLEAIRSDIENLKAQLKPLHEQRNTLERKAHRHANFVIFSGLGYCVLQFVAIGRLTWWELSWDVMEPVTYMLTFGTAIIGYTFFVMTGSEYTYEGLKRTLQIRKLRKLEIKTKFDTQKYTQLIQELHDKEQNFESLAKEFPQWVLGTSKPQSQAPKNGA